MELYSTGTVVPTGKKEEGGRSRIGLAQRSSSGGGELLAEPFGPLGEPPSQSPATAFSAPRVQRALGTLFDAAHVHSSLVCSTPSVTCSTSASPPSFSGLPAAFE